MTNEALVRENAELRRQLAERDTPDYVLTADNQPGTDLHAPLPIGPLHWAPRTK